MTDADPVAAHYGTLSPATVTDALRRSGFPDGPLNWEDLARLDQFHVGSLPATRELAAELDLQPHARVLDVGCGLGGASRFLAATYQAHVTGIDLTPSFVEIATLLSERTGFSDRVEYRVANALDLPFDDSSFDCAWTQHVAMNIGDRSRLYGEVRRVLESGALFAIHDIVKGNSEALIFPVPWARDSSTSFLLTPDAMRETLTNSGFEEVTWRDTTSETRSWLAEQSARTTSPTTSSLGLGMVMGPDFPILMGNLGRNLTKGVVRVVQTIVRAS